MSDRTPSSVRTGSLVGDAEAQAETPAGDAKPASATQTIPGAATARAQGPATGSGAAVPPADPPAAGPGHAAVDRQRCRHPDRRWRDRRPASPARPRRRLRSRRRTGPWSGTRSG